MPAAAGAMIVGQAGHRTAIEQPAIDGTRAEHELLNDRPEVVTEPSTDRHRESHLPARENLSTG